MMGASKAYFTEMQREIDSFMYNLYMRNNTVSKTFSNASKTTQERFSASSQGAGSQKVEKPKEDSKI